MTMEETTKKKMTAEVKIRPTTAEDRKKINSDYIIAMNQSLKKKLGIKRFAAVKRFYQNKLITGTAEWRTLVVSGIVVINNDLADDEIAIDQTLRNALGMKYFKIKDDRLKVSRLDYTFFQTVRSYIDLGQFMCLRVNYPSINDIEKKLCRISPNALQLLHSVNGNAIWVECCSSDYKHEIRQFFNYLYDANYTAVRDHMGTIDTYFNNEVLPLPDELYIDIRDGHTEDLKDIAYIKALIDLYQDEKTSDKDRAEYKRVLNNIIAYGEWMTDCKYKMIDEKIIAYEYYPESEDQIHDYQKEHDASCNSFEAIYPNSDMIFDMHPDLETIRLDKYYRDILELNILDTVKVKRRWLDEIRDNIIDYGLVFVLTVFAAIVSVDPDNIQLLGPAILVSIVFTVFLILFQSR